MAKRKQNHSHTSTSAFLTQQELQIIEDAFIRMTEMKNAVAIMDKAKGFESNLPSKRQQQHRKQAVLNYLPTAFKICPVTLSRDDIISTVVFSANYPVNQTTLEAMNPCQILGCALWLLDYFDERDRLENKQLVRDQQSEDTVEDESDRSATKSLSTRRTRPRTVWDDVEDLLPYHVPPLADYDLPFFSDTVYPDQLIDRVVYVLKNAEGDCDENLQGILDIIDTETKTRLENLYVQNVDGIMMAALRLRDVENRERDRFYQNRVSDNLKHLARTHTAQIAGMKGPVVGAPYANPLAANGQPPTPETLVQWAKSIVSSDVSKPDMWSYALSESKYEEKHYPLHLLIKGYKAYRLNEKDAREALGSKVVYDETIKCVTGDPYDLCMAFMLLSHRNALVLGLDGVGSMILSYAHSLLPWDVEDIDTGLKVVERQKSDYTKRYLENPYLNEQLRKSWSEGRIETTKDVAAQDDSSEYASFLDIPLDEEELEWVRDQIPRTLNLQQLFYLTSGHVLPRTNHASQEVIKYAKACGASEDEAREIAMMTALTFDMNQCASHSREQLLKRILHEMRAPGPKPETVFQNDEDPLLDDLTERLHTEMHLPASEEEMARLRKEISTLRMMNNDLSERLKTANSTVRRLERDKKRTQEVSAAEREKAETERAELAELRSLCFL